MLIIKNQINTNTELKDQQHADIKLNGITTMIILLMN